MAIYVNFKEMGEASSDLKANKENVMMDIDAFNQTLNETLDHDWKGSDANAFVITTKDKVNKLSEEYNEYFNEIINQIDRNSQKFADNQRRNIDMLDD